MADTIFKPTQIKEIAELVAWAVSESQQLEIIGGATKRDIGRATSVDHVLDLSQMNKITLYEPEELVLKAYAGTPIDDIERVLKKHNQELAFEPANYNALFGRKQGNATLGGVIAANISGPRRIRAGAARDHFLGVTAVSGRGEIFKSGGRVVKNVTGYDMCKLLAGSWGTLAVMSEICVKVLPASADQSSVVIIGLTDEMASKALAAAMKSDCEVTGAAHLPAAIAKRSAVAAISSPGKAQTIFRLEGVGPSVEYRTDRLIGIFREFGRTDVLPKRSSKSVWREIRDVVYMSEPDNRCVWRVSLAPSDGAEFVKKMREKSQVSVFYDWAGGLVWLSTSAKGDGCAGQLREILALFGGHATLLRAPADLRQKNEVFHPQLAGVQLLTERIKRGFDPSIVLNPERMYARL